MQKKSCKRNIIRAFNPGNSKELLTLLTEIIALYIRLITYTSGDLDFKNIFQSPSKRGAQASKTVLRVFCRFFCVYLATKSLEELIITKSATKRLTKSLLQSNPGDSEDSNELLEICSLQKLPQLWIEIILAVKIEQDRTKRSKNRF